MPKSRNVVAWDSSVLIAWVSNERRADPLERAGILECVQQVMSGKLRLVMSDAVRSEVLPQVMDDVARERLSEFLKQRTKVTLLSSDARVWDLAGEIRASYIEQHKVDGKGKIRISLPDAVHLATAIHYSIPLFYTFDDGKKGGRSLLSLDGDVAGHSLAVKRPLPVQMPIDYEL